MPENDLTYSVVITTYNRATLLPRAVNSALQQGTACREVIVVDDASTDSTRDVASTIPSVRYLRQDVNSGPGPARDRGIREASAPYVVLLDDDDELLPCALDAVSDALTAFPDANKYPVVQFRSSNGRLGTDMLIAQLEDYWNGQLQGDFTPVINRERYLAADLSYPTLRVGGESLLWWDVARRFGIPTWSASIVQVHSHEGLRLTSTEAQLRHAGAHTSLARLTLERFEEDMRKRVPSQYRSRLLALGTYGILSRDRAAVSQAQKALRQIGATRAALMLGLLSLLPQPVVVQLFRAYRARTTP